MTGLFKALALAAAGVCAAVQAEASAAEKPAFAIGIMSDTHVTENPASFARVEQAYRFFRSRGVDAIIHNGDLADTHLPKAFAQYRALREKYVLAGPKVPQEIFTFGGHDAIGFPLEKTDREKAAAFESFRRQVGFTNGLYGRYEFAGYVFLLFPEYGDLARLDAALAKECAAAGDRPVFVIDHEPGRHTTEMSDVHGHPGRRKILDKYRNVVTLTAHCHASLWNERQIWQDTYLNVNDGCLTYFPGSMTGGERPHGQNYSVLVLELFKDRFVVRRHLIADGTEIRPDAPWTFRWPEDYARKPYSFANRAKGVPAPRFAENAALKVEVPPFDFTGYDVEIPATTVPGAAWFYRLDVEVEEGTRRRVVSSRELMTDYWKNPADRRPTMKTRVPREILRPGERIRLRVTPVGFFRQEGAPLTWEGVVPAFVSPAPVWEGLPPPVKPDGSFAFDYAATLEPDFAFPADAGRVTLALEAEIDQPEDRHFEILLRRRGDRFGNNLVTTPGRTGLRRYCLRSSRAFHKGERMDLHFRFAGSTRLKIKSLKIFSEKPAASAPARTPVKSGTWKVFTYDAPTDEPIVFSGWCRTAKAQAVDCTLWLDVEYDNGEAAWGVKAPFDQGTHDWQERTCFFLPTRPVKKITALALFRNPKGAGPVEGHAEFADLRFERREGRGETTVVSRLSNRPFGNEREISKDVFTGRKIRREKTLEPIGEAPASPLAAGTYRVWTEDSMVRVSPLTFPKADARESIALTLAKRERESAQVLLSTAADVSFDAVELVLPVLRRADGRPLAGTVKWERQGYLAREAGANPHPDALPREEMWFPEPLLPAAPMKVRPAATQGAWITVYAAPEAEAGVYSGTLAVVEKGVEKGRVPLAVEVLPFALPHTFGLKTAFSLMDCFLMRYYPDDFDAKRREAWDVMLDHRLNPDDISRTSPPRIEDLLHARDRGMNCFNVLNVVPKPKSPRHLVLVAKPEEIFNDAFYAYFVGVVKPYFAELKKHGLDPYAYVYGFDERTQEFYKGIHEFWRKLQRDVPGLPLMATAKNYRDYAKGRKDDPYVLSGDWYCPVTYDYDLKVNEELRRAGKQVWWYTCCGPYYPYCNFASWEYPLVEGRLMGWMTHRYRADGFLFWVVNYWYGGYRFKEDDVYFPGFRTYNRNGCPGDGIFLFPGERHVLPGIRLAQCRDAEEDYECLKLVAERFGLEKADAASGALIRSPIDFTRDPAALRRARAELQNLLSDRRPSAGAPEGEGK